MNIVSTNSYYNSNILRMNLNILLRTYPFLNVQIVGNSILGSPIYVIKLGRGSKKVFYSASIHANEWITSPVLMKFIEDYCISYVNDSNLYGYSVREIFNSTSIYVMPMVNPDGVDLVTGNLDTSSPAYLNATDIAANFPDIPFPNRMEGKYKRCGFEFTISCRMGTSSTNQVCSRIHIPCSS
jgi:g-D-glutamyl-meso-diaminopimelate peptidase